MTKYNHIIWIALFSAFFLLFFFFDFVSSQISSPHQTLLVLKSDTETHLQHFFKCFKLRLMSYYIAFLLIYALLLSHCFVVGTLLFNSKKKNKNKKKLEHNDIRSRHRLIPINLLSGCIFKG